MADNDFMAAARQRITPHLAALAQRHAPGIDPDAAAAILLNPDHPVHAALVSHLDDVIPKSAQGHVEGIADSERNGAYSLGPGDQKVYGSLRDSNLLNSVLNRQPVPSSRHLVGGINYGVDEDNNPAQLELPSSAWGKATTLSPATRAQRLNDAVGYHEAAEADPQHHSSWMSTHYPGQHSLGNTENNGDTVVGQVLSEMNVWPTASMRASRRDDAPLLKNDQPDLPFMPNAAVRAAGDLINHGYKWGSNILSGLSDSRTHERAEKDVGRASFPVPEGMTPDQRSEYGNALRGLVEQSGAPSVKDYGHSKGVQYSPAGEFWADMGHEAFDPFSVASLGFGLVGGLGKGFAKAAAGVVAREGIDEVSSPLNWLAVTQHPDVSNSENFKTSGNVPTNAAAEYSAQQVQRDKAIEEEAKLRKQRTEQSWLPRGGLILP